jgi:prepilin-type processing-associated H-X9-DG protein
MNNLKQFGMIMAFYTDDNDEYLPIYLPNSRTWTRYTGDLYRAGYLSKQNVKLMTCPSDPKPYGAGSTIMFPSSYGFNLYVTMSFTDIDNRRRNLKNHRKRSKVMLIIDTIECPTNDQPYRVNNGSNYFNSVLLGGERHGGRVNSLMLDWHVEQQLLFSIPLSGTDIYWGKI